MPRDNRANQNEKRAKGRRAAAIARVELGQPTVPRESASGATSMAIKAEDPKVRAMIDDALARRATTNSESS